jgi:MFS transporter, ACS family, glucarate transporter
MAGLPYLFAAAGSFVGGGMSDWLVRITGSRRWGRSLLSATGFFLAGVCVLATGFVTSAWQATALSCCALFFNDLGIPPVWAACNDIGGRYSGTLSAIMNMAGGLGSITSPALIPVIDRALSTDFDPTQRWRLIFIMLSSAWFVGAGAWLCINAARRLEQGEDR